jgi:hypothetical protein
MLIKFNCYNTAMKCTFSYEISELNELLIVTLHESLSQ